MAAPNSHILDAVENLADGGAFGWIGATIGTARGRNGSRGGSSLRKCRMVKDGHILN